MCSISVETLVVSLGRINNNLREPPTPTHHLPPCCSSSEALELLTWSCGEGKGGGSRRQAAWTGIKRGWHPFLQCLTTCSAPAGKEGGRTWLASGVVAEAWLGAFLLPPGHSWCLGGSCCSWWYAPEARLGARLSLGRRSHAPWLPGAALANGPQVGPSGQHLSGAWWAASPWEPTVLGGWSAAPTYAGMGTAQTPMSDPEERS